MTNDLREKVRKIYTDEGIVALIQREKEAEGREIAGAIINKLRLSEENRPVDLDIINTLIRHRYGKPE